MLIGVDEVLKVLGIKRPTLYSWIRKGKLLPHRVGRLLKFDEQDVRAMISENWVVAWLVVGQGEDSILRGARATLRSETSPNFRFIFLEPPGSRVATVRVQVHESFPPPGNWVDDASVLFGSVHDALDRAKAGGALFFTRSEERLIPWKVTDYSRRETGGTAFFAAKIARIEPRERSADADALRRLREGVLVGERLPWTREELYRRGRS